MADDLTIKEPIDPTKINITQSWEVDYWCKKLNCTKSQLIIAVHAVGPYVKDVARFLQTHKYN